MVELPTALTIAGSDSGGGAGIQADIKTMEALNVYAATAITSVTAQNTEEVTEIEDISTKTVAAQIDAVIEDLGISTAKTGMLSSKEIIETVAEKTREHSLELVVDPVMVAQSGDRLLKEEAEETMRNTLLPLAKIVTPNIDEAEILCGFDIETVDDMSDAGEKITDLGAGAALIKGGHLESDTTTDLLFTEESTEFIKPRIKSGSIHGTGCALSSAIAAGLAKNQDLKQAIGKAEHFIHRAIKYGYSMGRGSPPLHHMAGIRNEATRFDVLRDLRGVVDELRGEDVSAIIPEVGMNIALSTPYAVTKDEVAAVEGRITRGVDSIVTGRGVWFGASGHMARYLLELREYRDDIRAAANIRNTESTRDAARKQLECVEIDRDDEPDDLKEKEGGSMEWSVRYALDKADGDIDALIDNGGHGKEPIIRLSATGPRDMQKKIISLSRNL